MKIISNVGKGLKSRTILHAPVSKLKMDFKNYDKFTVSTPGNTINP